MNENTLNHESVNQALDRFGTVTMIEHASDINGATIGQAVLLMNGVPNMTPDRVDGVYMATNNIALKLGALRYHAKNFRRIQDERIREIPKQKEIIDAIGRGILVCEKDLLHEFEGYFHQLKSCLDMLVKILVPVWGSAWGDVQTYGTKNDKVGGKLLDYLDKLKDDRKKTIYPLIKVRLEGMREIIEQGNDTNLHSLIKIRTNLTHNHPYIKIGFGWNKEVGRVVVPKVDAGKQIIPLADVIEGEAERLISFANEFITRTFSTAFSENLGIIDMNINDKKYLGALHGLDLSRAFWKIAGNINKPEYSEEEIERAKKIHQDFMEKR